MSASRQWQDQLGAWAIPEAIREGSPAGGDPWKLDVSAFVDHALSVDGTRTADRLGREALGDGGTVLDVGCGGGAAVVGLGDAVTHATGVDEREDMLTAFSEVMAARDVACTTATGRWPDVADEVDEADVVVSHHVAYNVPDLDGFLRALDAKARRRVVLEVHDRHPRSWTNPYWQALHDVTRPDGPTVDDLVAVAREAGLDPQVTVDDRPGQWMADRDRRLDHLMGHLCLHPDDRPRLEAADAAITLPETRRFATVWWDA